jgi:hypothetical protein
MIVYLRELAVPILAGNHHVIIQMPAPITLSRVDQFLIKARQGLIPIVIFSPNDMNRIPPAKIQLCPSS